MAVPLAIGSTVSAVAGGIVGGIGAKESADASAASYNYKAGVALLNKQINEQNANWATSAGDAQAEASGLQAKQQIAGTKVTQGASGLDVNSGSNATVTKDQTAVAQYDQNVIRWDAAKTAYGYQTKATMDTAESQLDLQAASQAKSAGNIAMITSFLGAGANVASKWSQASMSGMTGGSSSAGDGSVALDAATMGAG